MTLQDFLAAKWMQSPLIKGGTYVVGTGLAMVYADIMEGKQWNDMSTLIKAGAAMFAAFKMFTSNPNGDQEADRKR